MQSEFWQAVGNLQDTLGTSSFTFPARATEILLESLSSGKKWTFTNRSKQGIKELVLPYLIATLRWGDRLGQHALKKIFEPQEIKVIPSELIAGSVLYQKPLRWAESTHVWCLVWPHTVISTIAAPHERLIFAARTLHDQTIRHFGQNADAGAVVITYPNLIEIYKLGITVDDHITSTWANLSNHPRSVYEQIDFVETMGSFQKRWGEKELLECYFKRDTGLIEDPILRENVKEFQQWLREQKSKFGTERIQRYMSQIAHSLPESK
jgi:hypothetical protein